MSTSPDVVSLQKMEMLNISLRTAPSWFGRWSAQFWSQYHHKHYHHNCCNQQQFQEGWRNPFPSILCTVQNAHRKGDISSWSHLRTAWCKLGVQKALWELERAVLGLPSPEHTLGPHVLPLTVAEKDYPNFWPFTFTVTTLWWHLWEKQFRSTIPKVPALTWGCLMSKSQRCLQAGRVGSWGVDAQCLAEPVVCGPPLHSWIAQVTCEVIYTCGVDL